MDAPVPVYNISLAAAPDTARQIISRPSSESDQHKRAYETWSLAFPTEHQQAIKQKDFGFDKSDKQLRSSIGHSVAFSTFLNNGAKTASVTLGGRLDGTGRQKNAPRKLKVLQCATENSQQARMNSDLIGVTCKSCVRSVTICIADNIPFTVAQHFACPKISGSTGPSNTPKIVPTKRDWPL